MDLDKNQFFLIIIVLVIVVAGSGLLFWQVYNKHQQQAPVFAGESSLQTVGDKEEGNISREANSKNVSKDENDRDISRTEENKVIVHVAGAVKENGVYELKPGSRIINALNAAGGETEEADLDRINLAAPVSDGEQVFIPYQRQEKNKVNDITVQKNNNGKNFENTGKINVNIAGQGRLEELSGIGPSKAQSIIEYREKIGKYTDLEQLLEVSGIGEKTLKKIEDELVLR